LKAKGTELHAACVIGDTVGDPFKDTSSVALNPIIKFTTLFGLLAVELAVSMTRQQGATVTTALAVVFLACAMISLSQLLRHADRKQISSLRQSKKGQAKLPGPFSFLEGASARAGVHSRASWTLDHVKSRGSATNAALTGFHSM
jgi:phosphotransferase system  glucose/maltose/N-acetylglucosamine-specific IIC component